MADLVPRHVTVSDTDPDRGGKRGTAQSRCLVCPWTHTLRWSGPTNAFEPNALAITQAHATAHEKEP